MLGWSKSERTLAPGDSFDEGECARGQRFLGLGATTGYGATPCFAMGCDRSRKASWIVRSCQRSVEKLAWRRAAWRPDEGLRRAGGALSSVRPREMLRGV